jgi:hypothetical protein
MNVAQETLGFRRAGLSPALSLLMSAFALLIPPAAITSRLRRPTERSPTTQAFHLIQLTKSEPQVAHRAALRVLRREAQGYCAMLSQAATQQTFIEASGPFIMLNGCSSMGKID